MSARVIPVRIGDVELLVEATPVVAVGTEPTSRLDGAREKALDAFDRAQDAIVEIAASTAGTIGRLAKRSVHPDRLEVEFGVKVGVDGSVIVAGVSAEATVRILLSYDAARQA